jgi:transporter family-2 protein
MGKNRMDTWLFVGMMVASGLVMSFQAPINAGLRGHVGTFESSLISFTVGTALLVLVVLLVGEGSVLEVKKASWWQLLGGAIGAIFVTTTLLAAPRITVTGMLVAALVGQMLGALLIDEFGWFGMPRRSIEWTRIAGLVLLAGSVLLINWKKLVPAGDVK